MFTKIISFVVFMFVLVSPAFAQDDATKLMAITVKGAVMPEGEVYKVFLFAAGDKCPNELTFSTSEEADAAGLTRFYTVLPADQDLGSVMVESYFSIGTYRFNPVSKVYEYVLTSCGYDMPYRLEFTYTPVLPPDQPPPVESPRANLRYNLALSPTFALQSEATVGLMARLQWHTPLPHLVLVGGLGVEFYTLPPKIVSVRPVFELGLGGGLTTTIPKTKLTFTGALALGGGVGSFRTHCGSSPEYNPDMVYTCGSQDGFPMVFTGPWFGPMANLGVLGPIKAKRPLLVGGQFHITVPLHLMSNTWPRYQAVEGRTVTVHTTAGDREISYRWAEDTMLNVVPTISGGIIFMW